MKLNGSWGNAVRARLVFLVSPIMLAAIAMSGIALIEVMTLWNSRADLRRDALIYVDNHAQIAEEHARLTLREVVESLRVAAGFLESAELSTSTRQLDSFVDRIRSASPRLERVAIIDTMGHVIAGDVQGTDTTGGDHPVGSQPPTSVMVHANDEFVLVDLPFGGPTGARAGVVRGAVTKRFFADFYATINIRPGSDLGLILSNGEVAIREHGGPISSIAPPRLDDGPRLAGAELVSVEGMDRFQSFRYLGDLPVVVYSALGADYVFAPWWRTVQLFAVLSAVLAAILLFLGRSAVRGQRRRRWLATIVESSSEAIWSRDREGRIRSWNKGAEQLFGYHPNEILGRHASLLWPPEESTRLSKEAERLNDYGSYVYDEDTVRRCKDGNLVAVSVTASPIRDDTGKVIGAALTARDISDKKEVEQHLYRLAYHDSLVDLPNRASLEERLAEALEKSIREDASLAFHYLDVDHFKDVNDSFGHRMGDQLLKEVADRIGEVVRRQDTVGRLGGDEFGIIQRNVGNEEEAAQLAERILARLSAPFRIENREIGASVSIGTAVMPAREVDSLGSEEAARVLFQRADIAMYAAKSAGRQRHSIYADHHGDRVRRKMEIQESLARAVRNGALTLRYQPQVELESGRMIGVEALVRWTDPELGVQAPSEFIEIAEQTGLIVPLGAWVLREACSTAMRWPDPALKVSVNVSAVQLRRGGLFDLIRDTLEDTGFPPHRLELELTESALFHDTEDVTSLLWALRALGVRLAVDDFGTGYSTLSYFKDFPVDTLKIDRSFIEGLAPNSRTLSIVRAAAAMAEGLGLELVAEGIETEIQSDMLRQVGIVKGQGFLFARPVTGDALADMLRAPRNVVHLETGANN